MSKPIIGAILSTVAVILAAISMLAVGLGTFSNGVALGTAFAGCVFLVAGFELMGEE